MRPLAKALGTSLLIALVCAVLLDALGATTIAFRASWCVGVAALGGLQAMAWPGLFASGAARGGPQRRGVIGFVVAGALSFALGRAPFGWIDLGAIAAGLPGEMPLVVLPAASALAVLAAWNAPRAAR